MLGLVVNVKAGIRQFDRGVVIDLPPDGSTAVRLIKIEVCSAEIIHVQATVDTVFSTRPSLMVAEPDRLIGAQPVNWTVTVDGDTAVIETDRLLVKVSLSLGTTTFYKADGTVILREKAAGSKLFTAAEVMGEKTYHIQQLFDSPADEAFYGLGQHQNGVMNYKGHDVDLWQYNIVAAVPFLISSRHYGILWDNNSRTKFGDIRDYAALSGLKLYDKNGQPGGLTAEYFLDRDFKKLFTSRSEAQIAHDFLDVGDKFPDGFDKVAAVRWSGTIASTETGLHKFRLYCCSYTRMWLNGQLVVDNWRQNWLPWTHYPELYMEAGKKYDLKIEWIHNGGYIGLKYLTPADATYSQNLSLYSEVADQIDYYFIYGAKPDEIIAGYRKITGRAPMMPKWTLGLWQSRQRYKTQDEVLSVVQEFRRRQIPFDNIVQDWFYWEENKWGEHEFDPARFPDPEQMVKDLHEKLHAHIMISVWPKFYVGTENYRQFRENGWLYLRNVEKQQRDWVGPGYVSTFYDPYSAGARDLYWKQIREKLFDKGFYAWWLDATEPDIQSNLSPDEARLRMHPTALGTAARYLNTYSLMQCKGIYENQLQAAPDQRIFILTRSAFAGQQRYSAATWSGDIAARWFDMRNQIAAGLNFSLSGIPYWTMDIGGFAVESRYEKAGGADLDEWRELNTRWFQFGTFCPLLRVHGEFPYREMFNIAPEKHPAYQAMLSYDKLRYRLLPYIYSLAGMVTQEDYTIMRALVMDFGDDQQVLNIGDQFMLGPALLVNPVTEYKARSRAVYLPAGTGWYDLKSGQHFAGGQTIQAAAPYSDIPLFVREGAIIPFGPEIQYADEKPADPLILYVYTGQDGRFELYEDENDNNNYIKGQFTVIPLTYSEQAKSLTIGQRQGAFPGMLSQRTFWIIWVDPAKKVGLNFDRQPDAVVRYNGAEVKVKMYKN
jgi:alpha-D-xyloside xylohydrolase